MTLVSYLLRRSPTGRARSSAYVELRLHKSDLNRGNWTCPSALPRSDSSEGKTGTRSSPSGGHPRRECLLKTWAWTPRCFSQEGKRISDYQLNYIWYWLLSLSEIDKEKILSLTYMRARELIVDRCLFTITNWIRTNVARLQPNLDRDNTSSYSKSLCLRSSDFFSRGWLTALELCK